MCESFLVNHFELMSSAEDTLLIKAFSNGDTGAFDVLFLKYQPRLVAFINGFIKDEDEARDIAQDIFLRLWKNRSSHSEIRSFEAFLIKTAKFAIYNYYDHLLVNDKFVERMLFTPVQSNDVEEQVFADELMEIIQNTIDNMPKQRRRVFEMSRKEGKTNDEIAKMMHISKRTVENHITCLFRSLYKNFIFKYYLHNLL